MTFKPGDLGSFVPTTDIFDLDDPKELLVQLRQVVNDMALVLNTKDTGIYPEIEFVNGQLWFPNTVPLSGKTPGLQRQIYRKVINFGALPNTATKSVAHGITLTSTATFTRIYGTANDLVAPLYIPLPFASPTLADNISVTVDGTNVNVTTGNDRTNFTVCYIVLEYIQE